MPHNWGLNGSAYPKLIRNNKLDKGGRFAAWAQPEPELFSTQIRAALRSLRELELGAARTTCATSFAREMRQHRV